MKKDYLSKNQANLKRLNPPDSFSSLNSRQTYILECLMSGLTCKEIAARLHVRPRSVYLQVALLKARFDAQTLAQLVSRADESAANQLETEDPEREL